MSASIIWKCIICGYEAKDTPPRRCVSCDTPASKFRLVADRAPSPPPEPAADETPEVSAAAEVVAPNTATDAPS